MTQATQGHLDADEIFALAARRQVNEHLQSCASCQADYRSVERLFEPPRQQPPIALPTILNATGEWDEAGQPLNPNGYSPGGGSVQRAGHRRVTWVLIAGIAGALLIVAGAIALGLRLLDGDPAPQGNEPVPSLSASATGSGRASTNKQQSAEATNSAQTREKTPSARPTGARSRQAGSHPQNVTLHPVSGKPAVRAVTVQIRPDAGATGVRIRDFPNGHHVTELKVGDRVARATGSELSGWQSIAGGVDPGAVVSVRIDQLTYTGSYDGSYQREQ